MLKQLRADVSLTSEGVVVFAEKNLRSAVTVIPSARSYLRAVLFHKNVENFIFEKTTGYMFKRFRMDCRYYGKSLDAKGLL